ncbi:MAG: heavy-metal-associated domain-containing protein [Proteobacteria bacterium]|nr:heavy-metal-associated domain-containing protein [Pseudomonadota bacterium]MBU1738999.1 heavy-metal-associated domain-containing protein [Pseudomonadota bacterium]
MNKKSVIGVVVGVVALLVVASISFVAARNVQTPDEKGFRTVSTAGEAAPLPTGDVEETTLQVSRLSCGSCLYTIESELRKFDGMVGMKADLASGLVVVAHTKDFTPARIASVITETGYPATVVDSAAAGNLPKPGASGSGGSGCNGCGPRGCSYPRAPQQQG